MRCPHCSREMEPYKRKADWYRCKCGTVLEQMSIFTIDEPLRKFPKARWARHESYSRRRPGNARIRGAADIPARHAHDD